MNGRLLSSTVRSGHTPRTPSRAPFGSSRPGRSVVAALLLAFTVAGGAGGLFGCATANGLIAQRAEVFTPGVGRISIRDSHSDIISLDVFNKTDYPMTVLRDAFLLSTTSRGTRSRLPGGVAHVYVIPPGGVHEVNLRFDLHDLHPGEQALLLSQDALIVNGQPVFLEPLPFVVR